MDNTNPLPPKIPGLAHVRPTPPPPPPLGTQQEEREPLTSPIAVTDAILRQPRRVMYQAAQAGPSRLILNMLVVLTTCCVVYGVIVGTFSNGTQLWAAPLKVVGGLLLSALICFPSLYIFTCLSGSQARLGEICGLMTGMLLLSSILLVGFGPVAWLFSQSTESIIWMGALHLLFWFIAAGFGLRFLDSAFSHSQARSKAGLNTWAIIFMLVAVQMTTALRPIVGTATTLLPAEKKFFLAHWSDCLNSTAPAHR